MKNVYDLIQESTTEVQDDFTLEIESLEEKLSHLNEEEHKDVAVNRIENMNTISKILGEIRDNKHPHITDIFNQPLKNETSVQHSLDEIGERMEECINFLEDCEQGLEVSEENISIQVALMEATYRFYEKMQKIIKN